MKVYILPKTASPSKYPTLRILNEIVLDDFNNDQVGRQKQSDPDRDNIASFGTINFNLAPVGH